MSKIIKAAVATIANNDSDGLRITLSIAEDIDGSSFISTESGEDCGPHFQTAQRAEDAIYDLYGKTSAWDLQYA